jgi:hypothetical protein
MNFDITNPWYHGSPLELTSFRAGSMITQKRELARIFSHKTTLVSVSDDGRIKHNGSRLGYLYIIEEEIKPDDVIPHPHTTMAAGDEWLTKRELSVQLLGLVETMPGEQLRSLLCKSFWMSDAIAVQANNLGVCAYDKTVDDKSQLFQLMAAQSNMQVD